MAQGGVKKIGKRSQAVSAKKEAILAAALAAGNTVLAKPAEQTPLIAAQGVAILLEAGVPPGVIQLLPGRGETVGAALTSDERVRGCSPAQPKSPRYCSAISPAAWMLRVARRRSSPKPAA